MGALDSEVAGGPIAGGGEVRVAMIGHATLRIESGGAALLTDPWLLDPIGRSGRHFPPLADDPRRLAAAVDAIHISHVHPDHFHPPSLALFPRDIPVYIGAHRRKGFRDAIARLGFPVVEVPFQETVAVRGTPFEIAVLDHDCGDAAAYDSAAVVRTPEFTVFENNDCVLRPEKYAWVKRHFDVDYAFLGYSSASSFPIAFELEAAEKQHHLDAAAERRYGDFVAAALALAPRLAVPFANGLRFLDPATLWRNVAFNSALEAARRLAALGLRAEPMGPGDRILAGHAVARAGRVVEGEEELAALAAAARALGEPPGRRQRAPRADLVARFREHVLGLWRATRDSLPAVRDYVIAYALDGAADGRFYFDFSRPEGEVFQAGEPARYDMRYSYPAAALEEALDGEIGWDELNFCFASVHQVRYARDFHVMLRSDMLDLE